jgi:hypothetical protein
MITLSEAASAGAIIAVAGMSAVSPVAPGCCIMLWMDPRTRDLTSGVNTVNLFSVWPDDVWVAEPPAEQCVRVGVAGASTPALLEQAHGCMAIVGWSPATSLRSRKGHPQSANLASSNILQSWLQAASCALTGRSCSALIHGQFLLRFLELWKIPSQANVTAGTAEEAESSRAQCNPTVQDSRCSTPADST